MYSLVNVCTKLRKRLHKTPIHKDGGQRQNADGPQSLIITAGLFSDAIKDWTHKGKDFTYNLEAVAVLGLGYVLPT